VRSCIGRKVQDDTDGMLFLSFPMEQMVLLFFIMIRVSAILFTLPFLDARNIPVLLKAGLALAVSWMMMPQLTITPPQLPSTPLAFGIGIASEVGIGVIIGLAVQLLFVGVQLAGQMAGFQMGFAIANVVDPVSSLQIPMLSQFLYLFSMVLFLSLDLHHHFLMALMEAFERVPLWGASFSGNLFKLIMNLTADCFVIAVKIGAPVMAALLLASVALGLIARTVPQMQIFIVAMPLKIMLGLAFLGLSIPFIVNFLQHAFIALGQTVRAMIGLFI
jgi:flagellar biosynthetic protein FliR